MPQLAASSSELSAQLPPAVVCGKLPQVAARCSPSSRGYLRQLAASCFRGYLRLLAASSRELPGTATCGNLRQVAAAGKRSPRQLAASSRELQNLRIHQCVTTVIRSPTQFRNLYLMNMYHHSDCTCSLRNDLPFTVPFDFLARFHSNIYNPFTLSSFHFDGIGIRRDETLQ